jgi:hypothetical protein
MARKPICQPQEKVAHRLDIQEFKWNTLEGNPSKLIANFIASERRIKEVAAQLRETISSETQPVILSGHSLGGAILLEALELAPQCPNLHSVVLLGAAYPREKPLYQILNIAPQHYALNYHSPQWDLVLRVAYYNAMGVTAVGSDGLLNPGIFQNMKVNCSHDGHTGYARLVPGIIDLLAHSAGIKSTAKVKKSWPLTGIGNTGDWDNLYYQDGHIIQRHCITGDFRVIESGGVYQTRFHAKSIIPLLDEITALPV